MRIFAAILGLAVVLLQYRVWVSDHGVREVSRLTAAVEAQAAANVEQRERNRQLVAEVNDLKEGGLTALEERARSELGMVGNSETFYQVVTAATPAPAAPATTITARAQ
jgi:cell division protein FtsB